MYGKMRETEVNAELALRRLSFSMFGSAGHRQHFQKEQSKSELVYIRRS